jgi:hypothetical protein
MSDPSPDEMYDQETDQEVDPGEPIRQLAKFEHQASTGLLVRIRRAIQRRSTVAQLTSFSASVPLVVLREFWLILIEQIGPKSPRKDVTHGEETS